MEQEDDSKDMLEVVYDDLLDDTTTMYILIIAGRLVRLPVSKCDIDYMDKCIAVPRWLVEDRGLEAYVTNDDAYL